MKENFSSGYLAFKELMIRQHHPSNYHPDYLSLGLSNLANPYFKMPDLIINEMKLLIDGQETGYSSTNGDPEARQVLSSYENLSSKSNSYSSENIAILPGGTTEGIVFSVETILNNSKSLENEILVFTPNYWLIEEMVKTRLHGITGNLTTLPTKSEDNFLPTKEQIHKSITPNTKIIYITIPSNPTGHYLTYEQLSEVVNSAEKFGTYIIFDLAMYELSFTGEKTDMNPPSNYRNTIIVRTLSKDRGIPSFDIAYMCAPPEIIAKREGISYGDAGVFRTKVLTKDTEMRIKLLMGDLNDIDTIKYLEQTKSTIEKLKHNLDISLELLSNYSQIDNVIIPKGGLTLLFHINSTKQQGGFELVNDIFNKTGVTFYPGIVFGMLDDPTWIRMGLCYTPDHISEGLHRLGRYLNKV